MCALCGDWHHRMHSSDDLIIMLNHSALHTTLTQGNDQRKLETAVKLFIRLHSLVFKSIGASLLRFCSCSRGLWHQPNSTPCACTLQLLKVFSLQANYTASEEAIWLHTLTSLTTRKRVSGCVASAEPSSCRFVPKLPPLNA
jgi:hypothetical protein